jgi:hypothetical protein
LPLRERPQLARPELPNQDHADVAPAQPLMLTIGDATLARLGDVVLQAH